MKTLNWGNLSGRERRRYMQIQMSPNYSGHSAYLPDDCSECPCCEQPSLGTGLCTSCLAEWRNLRNKLEGK